MEWSAPGLVLDARPLGEGDAVVTLLTEAQGRHAGLARGGASRRHAATWLAGNLVEARWVARLPEQLGTLTGELVHPGAALAMERALDLALLSAACAVAAEVLPDREPHPALARGLVALVAHLQDGAEGVLADYARWELRLLAELGYGLDLGRCGATGTTEDLTHVSPRTGRAICAEAAAPWVERLLPLPGFLAEEGTPGDPAGWAAALRLTGHFLTRDALGARHRPLPAARDALATRVADLALAA